MSNDLELQEEEEEALLSIYYGDPAFKQVSRTVYQYKCATENDSHSFILEVSWPETYPTEKPIVNLDIFYNDHLSPALKEYIKEQLYEKAEQYLGFAVTYTLFDLAKDNVLTWLTNKTFEQTSDTKKNTAVLTSDISKLEITESSQKKIVKKEHLTKAQKRRQWDKGEGKDDKPRGWNWVDIIKHLSQTGSKESA